MSVARHFLVRGRASCTAKHWLLENRRRARLHATSARSAAFLILPSGPRFHDAVLRTRDGVAFHSLGGSLAGNATVGSGPLDAASVGSGRTVTTGKGTTAPLTPFRLDTVDRA